MITLAKKMISAVGWILLMTIVWIAVVVGLVIGAFGHEPDYTLCRSGDNRCYFRCWPRDWLVAISSDREAGNLQASRQTERRVGHS